MPCPECQTVRDYYSRDPWKHVHCNLACIYCGAQHSTAIGPRPQERAQVRRSF